MTNNDIILINPDRRQMALITLKHRLKLEIETGMSSSGRVSLIQACQNWGYEGPKSKKKCLAWVLEQLGE
jgi:hypothetical protein